MCVFTKECVFILQIDTMQFGGKDTNLNLGYVDFNSSPVSKYKLVYLAWISVPSVKWQYRSRWFFLRFQWVEILWWQLTMGWVYMPHFCKRSLPRQAIITTSYAPGQTSGSQENLVVILILPWMWYNCGGFVSFNLISSSLKLD